MAAGLQVATTLQYSIQKMKFEFFDHYREATALRKASQEHVQEAYGYEHQLEDLFFQFASDAKIVQELDSEAEELEKQAEIDQAKALEWKRVGEADAVLEKEEKRKGLELARLSEKEATQAQAVLEQAEKDDRVGREELAEAKSDLGEAQRLDDSSDIQGGICGWFPMVCGWILSDGNSEELLAATHQAISAAADMQEALELLQKAKEEQDVAKTLFYRSSAHGNESMAILENAKALKVQIEEEADQAQKYSAKETEEEEQARQDEVKAGEEGIVVKNEKAKLQFLYNATRTSFLKARQEAQRSVYLKNNLPEELRTLDEEELRVRQITFDAKQHVAHACWYALVSSILFLAISALLLTRIVRFLHGGSQPLFWDRRAGIRCHNILFLLCHVLIFCCTLGFIDWCQLPNYGPSLPSEHVPPGHGRQCVLAKSSMVVGRECCQQGNPGVCCLFLGAHLLLGDGMEDIFLCKRPSAESMVALDVAHGLQCILL